MAQVQVSETVPVPVQRAWEMVTDLSLFEQWLSLHDGWRSELPAELGPGTTASSIVKAKGIRNRIAWVVRDFDPPHRVTLAGEGVGGTKVSLAFALAEAGEGTEVSLDVDFQHPALRGPMGSIAARTIKGDIVASMKRLVGLAK